jgi:hypothetical protein
MDTYIKMCDCPEIQDKWKPKIGDFTDKGVIVSILLSFNPNDVFQTNQTGSYALEKHNFIWLPSQEQLQEMVSEGFNARQQLNRFNSFLRNYRARGKDSIKELWLAFVMQELHNKKWDVKKWF